VFTCLAAVRDDVFCLRPIKLHSSCLSVGFCRSGPNYMVQSHPCDRPSVIYCFVMSAWMLSISSGTILQQEHQRNRHPSVICGFYEFTSAAMQAAIALTVLLFYRYNPQYEQMSKQTTDINKTKIWRSRPVPRTWDHIDSKKFRPLWEIKTDDSTLE